MHHYFFVCVFTGFVFVNSRSLIMCITYETSLFAVKQCGIMLKRNESVYWPGKSATLSYFSFVVILAYMYCELSIAGMLYVTGDS